MKSNLVLFGTTVLTEMICPYIHNNLHQIDLIITISDKAAKGKHIAGFSKLYTYAVDNQIEIFEADSYSLQDERTKEFMSNKVFDLGISVGWQRLIPNYILEQFRYGVYGFHGSAGYLPFGKGRSPMNWSIILGDNRFIHNLFRYDEYPDSPNVFSKVVFEINQYDDIRTMQYKDIISSKIQLEKLINAYKNENIIVNKVSHDFETWYEKRTPNDGKIDFKKRTREIYNLVRATTKPFPGAFTYYQNNTVYFWNIRPFDSILDFSGYQPGEIIEIFDNKPIIRTIDGSIIVHEYEATFLLEKGMVLY